MFGWFREDAALLPHLHRLKPCGGRGGPGPHLGRSFRVLHLHQDGVGNQDPTINFSENIRTAKSDEIVERAGVGSDDHASGYPVFVGSNRSNVVMSLSRSSTV